MILKTRNGMWGIIIFFGFVVITMIFLFRNGINRAVDDIDQQDQVQDSGVTKYENPDETRLKDIQLILDAVVEHVNDAGHSLGDFGEVPTCNVKRLKIGTSELDLSQYLVPQYIENVPMDPDVGTLEYTGYTMCVNNHGSINISAPFAAQSKMQVLNQ